MGAEAIEIVRSVEHDVTEAFRDKLSADVEDGGFSLAEPARFTEEVAIQDPDGNVAVVVWQWKGVDVGGLFNGPDDGRRIGASHAEVTVRGVTLVTQSDDGPLLHRYIDWLDVFSQVGITISPRPIVDVRKVWSDEEIRELDRIIEESQADQR